MPTPIKLHVRVANGHLLSRANMARIVARATKPTDRYGNSFPSPLPELKHEPPYYREWRIQKTQHGYEFREVRSGSGICGGHKTIRALVIGTVGLGIKVEVEE